MMASLATARRRITAEDEHMFRTHATMLRGVLNEMQAREDFAKTLRTLDRVISYFATLPLGSCINPPATGWGRAVWSHLLAMADLKSHDAALVEARSIRDGLIVWDQFSNAKA
jgi:hypothetical protein